MEQAAGMSEHREKVFAAIDKGRLKKLGMDLVDIWSPTGEEEEIARFLGEHYESIGLVSRLQEFETDRFNALGTLKGDGTGIEFLFCGHIDTSYSGKEPGLPKLPAYQPSSWSETDPATGEEWIYGLGIYNMKGAIACYVEALNAIQDAGVKLKGNVTVGAVGGEIEMGAIDQYQGKHYRGGGCGACYLATHGGTADMAVIGEPSEMRVVLGHMGYVYHKITVYGTPAHTTYAHNAVNAILKMKKILDALERWAPKYREAHPYGNSNANVNIAAIEGGWPWRCSRTPVFCNLYMDTRLLPRQHPLEIKREIEDIIEEIVAGDPDLKVDLEMYMSNPGAEIEDDEYIYGAIKRAHKSVHGRDPETVTEGWISDASHITRYGVPTLNYGPSGRTRSGVPGWDPNIGEHVSLEDLYHTTKVYASLLLDVCGRPREEILPHIKRKIEQQRHSTVTL